MQASGILISIAVVFIAATVWDDMKKNGRITPARKTWLLVACLFAIVSAILQFVS